MQSTTDSFDITSQSQRSGKNKRDAFDSLKHLK